MGKQSMQTIRNWPTVYSNCIIKRIDKGISSTAFIICSLSISRYGGTREHYTDQYAKILQNYAEVFKEPTHLPPTYEIDHYIPLKKGIEPINVRSYRYAYIQKAEIEKQKEMLNSGLI